MKNDPITQQPPPSDGEEATADGGGDELSEEQMRLRVEAFQLKCATVRQQTQQELTRLADKRCALRARLGISDELMAQWRDEHLQMMLAQQQQQQQQQQ